MLSTDILLSTTLLQISVFVVGFITVTIGCLSLIGRCVFFELLLGYYGVLSSAHVLSSTGPLFCRPHASAVSIFDVSGFFFCGFSLVFAVKLSLLLLFTAMASLTACNTDCLSDVGVLRDWVTYHSTYALLGFSVSHGGRINIKTLQLVHI